MNQHDKWLQARRTMAKHRHASIRTKSGEIVEGSIFDEQSAANDPDGIGYVLLENKFGSIDAVYANEFEELIKAW